MKLYIDKKKKKFIEAVLICKRCNRSFPEDEMEQHVKNCKGEQPGYD